jgi:hypothetical protein
MVSVDKGVDTIKTAGEAGLFRGAKHKSVKVAWLHNGGCHEAYARVIIAEPALTPRGGRPALPGAVAGVKW